jgi:hypothetical protein
MSRVDRSVQIKEGIRLEIYAIRTMWCKAYIFFQTLFGRWQNWTLHPRGKFWVYATSIYICLWVTRSRWRELACVTSVLSIHDGGMNNPRSTWLSDQLIDMIDEKIVVKSNSFWALGVWPKLGAMERTRHERDDERMCRCFRVKTDSNGRCIWQGKVPMQEWD